MKVEKLKELINDESAKFIKWPWTYFTPEEIACKHCGEIWKDEYDEAHLNPTPRLPKWFIYSMCCLQDLRVAYGKAMTINSGHRCEEHNTAVGGASASQHLVKVAFDVAVPQEEQETFCKLAKEAGFAVARPYPDKGFVHLDNGPVRTW